MRRNAPARIDHPTDDTAVDRASGAVRSIQAADFTLSDADLERIWNTRDLERLARTYWVFLQRATLGLIRVYYGPDERRISLLVRRLTLLRFEAPEYDFDAVHGRVRWGIRDGLLVARDGRGKGHLQIDVHRLGPAPDRPGYARLRVTNEVANFYPAIASELSAPVYQATQSRVHVLVTYAFLRSLTRLDLAVSRVGRFDPAAPGPDQP
jgi:hypothetical protein